MSQEVASDGLENLLAISHLKPGDLHFMEAINPKSPILSTSHKLTTTQRLHRRNMERRRYEDLIKKSSIKYALQNAIKELQVHSNSLMTNRAHRGFPINCFKWAPEEFLFRVAQDNVLHVDVLIRILSKDELEVFKLNTDIQELIKWLTKIFTEYQLKIVSDNLLSTLKYYKANLDFNSLINFRFHSVIELQKAHFAAQNSHRRSEMFTMLQSPKALAHKNEILNSIGEVKQRYTINWFRALRDQKKLLDELALDGLAKEIEMLQQKIAKDMFVHKTSMDMYYVQIQDYKNRINAVNLSYETDLEYLNDEIVMNRLKVAKSEENLQVYKDRVNSFHTQIAAKLAQIARREEKKQRMSENMQLSERRPRVSKNKGKQQSRKRK